MCIYIYIYLHAYLQWVHWQKQYATISVAFTSVAFTVSAVFWHLFLLCPTLSDLFRPSNFQNVRFAFRCSGSICFCCAIPNDSKVPLYLLRLWISTREFLCSLLCSRNTCEATSRFVSVWTCVNFFWTCSHEEFSNFLFRTCQALARLWR